VFEAEQLVHLGAARGEHEHGKIGGRGFAAHFAQDLESVLAGQHEIEDHGVRTRREDLLESLLAVVERRHLPAGALEVVLQEIADFLLVLDHHHHLAHGRLRARMLGASARNRQC
jgi:hypothetical protein